MTKPAKRTQKDKIGIYIKRQAWILFILIIIRNGYTNLHHQQCARVSLSPYPLGHMLSLDLTGGNISL